MRIVAVGDIASALLGVRSYKEEFDKEKVVKILKNMIQYNKIDKEITNLLIENYDFIIKEATKESSDLMAKYLNITHEYNNLLKGFS